MYDSLAAALLALTRQHGARALQRRLEALHVPLLQAPEPQDQPLLARIDQAWQFEDLLRMQALEEAGMLVLGSFVRPPQTRFRAWLHAIGQPPRM